MGGFLNPSLNQSFKQSFANIIITSLIACCRLMTEECKTNKVYLPNHEEHLRNYLLENYLENDGIRAAVGLRNVPIRFLPEVPENYNADSNTYLGRTDIRVLSSNWLRNSKDYYIVECKRIDGTKDLNQKYVDEGIERFIGDKPKYRSYHNQSIMLGFVVKHIDCEAAILAIAAIHRKKAADMAAGDIEIIERTGEYYLCESIYTSQLLLSHIFYDVSGAIDTAS